MGAITFKCPNCGGELIFDPSAQNYKCEYCATTFTQQQIDLMQSAKEQDIEDEAQPRQNTAGADESSGDSEWEQANMYSCPSCGAEIVTDATTAATFCYYCHNPVVLGGRVSGAFRPDEVIPFKINRKDAETRFFAYIRKKRFVPKAFFNDSQIEKLSGVYYPYWIYDTKVDGELQAEGTQVNVWRAGDTEYTERKIFAVRRSGQIRIDNRTRNALQKVNRELVENVEPFKLEESTAFSMGYLSGFVAEKRDMEKTVFADQLHQETDRFARQLLKGTAGGYSSLNVLNERYHVQEENWRYTLLPVWVLTYKSGGNLFYFAMNGQTGKIVGKLPVAKRKLFAYAGVIGMITTIAGLIGGFLL